MNKKVASNKTLSYKSIVFWGIIALLTLSFIIAIIVRFVGSRTINSYDSLVELKGDEIFDQAEEKYIVYFYSSDEKYKTSVEAMEDIFFNYATFQKRNSSNKEVLKAYVVDLADPENAKCLVFESTNNTLTVDKFSDLKISDKSIPLMLVIENGKATSNKKTESEIGSYLQGIIDENK